MSSKVEIVTALFSTFYVSVFIDTVRSTAFGPVIFGKTPLDSHGKAQNFLAYLARRFPSIDISHINAYVLSTYYEEFLNEQVSASN